MTWTWTTSPTSPLLRRSSKIVPGYDCREGDHGAHGDEWQYVVSHAKLNAALSLAVFTPHLAGVRLWSGEPDGADLSLHTTFTVRESDIRHGIVGTRCKFIDEPCFVNWTSALDASDFFKAHGQATFEQAEAFWLALEMKLGRLYLDVLSRDPKVERCTCCDGRGVVAKKEQTPKGQAHED